MLRQSDPLAGMTDEQIVKEKIQKGHMLQLQVKIALRALF